MTSFFEPGNYIMRVGYTHGWEEEGLYAPCRLYRRVNEVGTLAADGRTDAVKAFPLVGYPTATRQSGLDAIYLVLHVSTAFWR